MHDAKMWDHLDHVTYPATKQDLVDACEKMSDVPEEDKKWFMENLPDRTYNNADEVKAALGSKSEAGMHSGSMAGL